MNQSTYLAINQHKIKKEGKKIELRYDYIILTLLGLLIGQAEISEGLFPLTLVYWSMIAGVNKYLVTGITVTMGIGLAWSGEVAGFIYLFAGVLGYLLYRALSRWYKNLDLSLFIAVSYFISALIYNYLGQVLLYKYLLTLGEAVFIYALSYLGLQGAQQLLDRGRQITRLGYLSLFVVISGILIGLSNIAMVPLIVLDTFVLFIIAGASLRAGLSIGVIIAVLLGMVMVLPGIIPVLTMLRYIIFSFSTGLFASRHKLWSLAGGIIAFMLYSGFSPTTLDLMNSLKEISIALLLFLITPLKVWEYLFRNLSQKEETLYQNQVPDVSRNFRQHMVELTRVFKELSITFKENIPVDIKEKKLDDFAFIIKNKVCCNCQRKRICWHQEKEDTYRRLILMIDEGEKRGNLDRQIIENHLRKKCPYYNQIISGVKNSFEILQINSFWRERLHDKQQNVSEQLLGISNIIERISLKSELTLTGGVSSDLLKKRAREKGLDLYSLEVNYGLDASRPDLMVQMEPCSGNSPCEAQFTDFISSQFDYDFRILHKECGNILKDKPCNITYGPVGKYRINLATVQKSLSGDVSGDSFLYKPLKDGKDLVVISDGMGVGEKASRESRAAINLLDSIIDAGFDQSLAIKTINSALYLRNQEESFTTLDIGIFDNFSGKMTFSKIGAVSSFIKREWDLIKIASASLPVGILDRIEVTSEEINLQPEDFVIMFTDGLLDIRNDLDDKEEWLRQILQNSSFDRPEDMVDYIMDVALNGKKAVSDDLTLVVFKIEEVDKKRRKITGFSRIK
jgi:stage II sporulation protein E